MICSIGIILRSLALFSAPLWAISENLVYEVDTTATVQAIQANLILVDRGVKFTTADVTSILVDSRTTNYGIMIFKTESTVSTQVEMVNYRFGGSLSNSGIFQVQHNNFQIPIYVTVENSIKRFQFTHDGGHQSINSGDIVFLSNGPTSFKDEFIFEIPERFSNCGIISILGTKSHIVRLRISEPSMNEVSWFEKTFLPTMEFTMQNTGFIFLKNAVLHQLVNFDKVGGCIALVESSKLVANTSFMMSLQQIFFHPGEGKALIVHKG